MESKDGFNWVVFTGFFAGLALGMFISCPDLNLILIWLNEQDRALLAGSGVDKLAYT